VRRIASGRGRYNIPNLGLFLWRLQSYRISDRPARPVIKPGDWRYHFDPIGRDVPLFNRPRRSEQMTRMAEEHHLPVRLRNAAVNEDLEEYRSIPEGERPAASNYYGPDRAFELERDGEPVSPIEIICWDLSDWRRPPTDVRLSAPITTDDLGEMPVSPQLMVTIAEYGPYLAKLTTVPSNLEEAGSLLKEAIGNAKDAAAFRGARVDLVMGDRLLVRSGRDGDPVSFAATEGDTETVGILGLDVMQPAVLSGDLGVFPVLSASKPEVNVIIGERHTARLEPVATELSTARTLLE
jgi:hypothetical protein